MLSFQTTMVRNNRLAVIQYTLRKNCAPRRLGWVSLKLLWSKLLGGLGNKVQAADTSMSSTFDVSWPLRGLCISCLYLKDQCLGHTVIHLFAPDLTRKYSHCLLCKTEREKRVSKQFLSEHWLTKPKASLVYLLLIQLHHKTEHLRETPRTLLGKYHFAMSIRYRYTVSSNVLIYCEYWDFIEVFVSIVYWVY